MLKIETLTLKEPDISDFALARNKLLESSKSEWILYIDTDERISEDLKKELESLNPEDFSGFYVKRKIIFLGREIGEDMVLRLGKKNSGKWARKVHETWSIKGKVGTLRNYIIHDTARDLHSYIEKMNKYSTLHALENNAEGKKANIIKIIFYPQAKFIQNIFSGRGFIFAMLQSFHSFLGWSKLWNLQKK